MKIKKEALRSARLLLKASLPQGNLDEGKVREFTARMVAEKPRHYLQILEAFQRLLGLELEKRHAIIESATELDEAARAQVLDKLKAKFGQLTSEFKTVPELIGGLRVKVGSTIWDSSIRTRLATLRQAVEA